MPCVVLVNRPVTKQLRLACQSRAAVQPQLHQPHQHSSSHRKPSFQNQNLRNVLARITSIHNKLHPDPTEQPLDAASLQKPQKEHTRAARERELNMAHGESSHGIWSSNMPRSPASVAVGSWAKEICKITWPARENKCDPHPCG